MQSEEEVSRSSISKPRFAGPILIHRQRTSGAGDDDSREQEQEKLRQFGFVDERSAHEDEVDSPASSRQLLCLLLSQVPGSKELVRPLRRAEDRGHVRLSPGARRRRRRRLFATTVARARREDRCSGASLQSVLSRQQGPRGGRGGSLERHLSSALVRAWACRIITRLAFPLNSRFGCPDRSQ